MLIKSELMEMNKPSELTQVMYFEDFNKMVFAELTPTQIDLINLLIYEAKKIIIKTNIHVDEDRASIPIEIELKILSKYLNKYTDSSYSKLINQLNRLRKVDIVINVLKKNKEMETTLTGFIHEIIISRHKDTKKKKITLHISTKILNMFLNLKKLFSKHYLTIQLSMKSKYSKLLYELLKDYQGVNSKIIHLDLLLGLLNVANNERYLTYSYFNNDILKKAIKEINEKSDIKVQYEAIKERTEDNPRLHVTKIKFTMEKQNDERLKELGLLNQEPELSIEEEIYLNKIRLKSKNKLEGLIQSGYEVKDQEAWIKADIKKNEKQYATELDLDEYLEDLSTEDKRSLYFDLAKHLKLDEPMVMIDNYCIKDFSNKFYTTSAEETIKILDKVLERLES